MSPWGIRRVLFDLNGTLLDPSAIAEPFGGTDQDRPLVSEAFHEALLLTMADASSGGVYRPLPEYLRPTLKRALREEGRDLRPLVDVPASTVRPHRGVGRGD